MTEIFSVDDDLKADPANCKIIATLSNGTIKTLCDVKEVPSTTSLTPSSIADLNSTLVPNICSPGRGVEPGQSCSCRIFQQARQFKTSLLSQWNVWWFLCPSPLTIFIAHKAQVTFPSFSWAGRGEDPPAQPPVLQAGNDGGPAEHPLHPLHPLQYWDGDHRLQVRARQQWGSESQLNTALFPVPPWAAPVPAILNRQATGWRPSR